jgi:ribonuclease HI
MDKAFGRRTKSDMIRQKLRSLVLFVSRANCTTPTIVAFAAAGVDLPDVKIRERYQLGLRTNQHVSNCSTRDQLYPPFRVPFKTSIIRDKKEIPKALGSLDIFSDGSKSGDRVGAAFVAFRDDVEIFHEKIKLASWCSSFQAEQVAIGHALKYVEGCALHARIFTDCQAIVVAAKSSSTKDRLMKALIDARVRCEKGGSSVQLIWIKGHNSLHGNDVADKLANEAAIMTNTTASFDWKSRVYVKQEVRAEMAIAQNKIYVDDQRLSKKLDGGELKDERDKRKNFWLRTFPSYASARNFFRGRRASQWLTQSLTGHGPFGSYLCEFGILSRENTRCACQINRREELREASSVVHVLTSCSLDGVARRRARLAAAMQHAGIAYGDWARIICTVRLGDLFFEVLRENYRNCVVANCQLEGSSPSSRLLRSGVDDYGKRGVQESSKDGGRVVEQVCRSAGSHGR